MLYIDRENLLIPYKGNQTALAAIEEAGKGPYEWAMEPDLCEVLFEEAECRLDLEKQKKKYQSSYRKNRDTVWQCQERVTS